MEYRGISSGKRVSITWDDTSDNANGILIFDKCTCCDHEMWFFLSNDRGFNSDRAVNMCNYECAFDVVCHEDDITIKAIVNISPTKHVLKHKMM